MALSPGTQGARPPLAVQRYLGTVLSPWSGTDRARQQGCAIPGATWKRGRCCPQPQLSVTSPAPLAVHRAVGQCQGLSVCPSVCQATPLPSLSELVSVCPSAPSWLCFIRVFPPKKTALKGATAARGHSWSPWAISGGDISHPEGSWTGVPADLCPFLPCVPQMSESETLITMVNRMVETSSPRAQLYMQVRLWPPGPAWLVPGGRAGHPRATRGHLLPPGVTSCHRHSRGSRGIRHIPLSLSGEALLHPRLC